MTVSAPSQTFTAETFDVFLAERREPAWLVELRRSCWQAFQTLSPPGLKDEEWMRTDIRTFRLDRFAPPVDLAPDAASPEAVLTAGVDLGGTAVALNSRPFSARLDPKWAAKDVLFGSLDELVRSHGDVIRPHLMTKAVDPKHDKFSALHGAFWSGGFLLYVPRGVVIDQPLHMLSAMTDGAVDLGHALVILEDGAEATVLAETASDSPQSGGLHCGAIELIVGAGARLRYVNLQDWGRGVWHFAQQKAVVGRDASIQWTIGALGSRLAHVRQHVALVGEGADAQVNGVLFTEGKQHLSYQTLQHHRAPHCHSDLLYKGGLQDKSRIVWRGMIKVDPAAQKTDGYQRNDNLMLSADARSDSIPGLEIEADDVRCTHGSTSGRVDDELIYYAQARGLTRNEAVRVIVTGFFQQVFDRITIESVREALGHAIRRRVREVEETAFACARHGRVECVGKSTPTGRHTMKTNKSREVGITPEARERVLCALDDVIDHARRTRAIVPALKVGMNYGNEVTVPEYYSGLRPQPVLVTFRDCLAPDDVRQQNDLAHWLNQNVVIRIYAVLDAHNIVQLLRQENEYAKLLCKLRQEFAYGHGRLKPSLMGKFTTLFPDVDVSGAERVGEFCLSIDGVIEPLVMKLREAIERLPVDGDSSPDAIRVELRQRLNKRPFVPFRLELVDGKLFEIQYPEINLVADTYVVVGHPAAEDANPVFYDRTDTILLSQIASMSTVETAAVNTSNG